MLLSVIILSYAINDDIYKMNCRCIDSLLGSESWKNNNLEILLFESNKLSKYEYNSSVLVIKPQERFNFHGYFNKGITLSSGDYIAFCNNDIYFEKNWFSSILKVANAHPRFKCFSPIDDRYPGMNSNSLPREKEFYKGWDYGKYFAPWCFVWKRSVFNIVGPFDEQFDFYAADADEANTLRKHAIYSVVCTKSVVRHERHQSVSKERKINDHKITDKDKYPLTEEEIKRGYSWLWDDDRLYWGYKREVGKWGNIQMTKRIQKVVMSFPFLNFRPLTKMLYSKTFNHVLCVLTGIKD